MTETLDASLPPDVEDVVANVLKAACQRELKLVTAESCTGGLLASLLTDVEGCSHVFERGFVVYTDAAKAELLGVPLRLLDRCGAVSAPVAEAMAKGALARSRGDIALSVTGYAGAAGAGEEAGLVYFGVARRGGPVSLHEAHYGDIGRGPVRLACLRQALAMIGEAIKGPPATEPSAAIAE